MSALSDSMDTIRSLQFPIALAQGELPNTPNVPIHFLSDRARFAIDVLCAEGTKVLAAQEGRVVKVERGFPNKVSGWNYVFQVMREVWSEGAINLQVFLDWGVEMEGMLRARQPSLEDPGVKRFCEIIAHQTLEQGNHVILEHADGAFYTEYWHLRNILVEIGQWVVPQKPLAEVAMSGVTTIPHLHFGASVRKDDKHTSVPVQFEREDINRQLQRMLWAYQNKNTKPHTKAGF